MTVLARLFPPLGETYYRGARAALWLLGLLVAIKLAMSVNSIFNTAAVAGGVDGIPLASYGPDGERMVLMFFAFWELGHLMIALTALLALLRYRPFVPLAYLVLLSEHGGRWLIAQSYATQRAAGSIPFYINLSLLCLLTLGLILSLLAGRGAKATGRA